MAKPQIKLVPLGLEYAELRAEAIRNSIEHLKSWLPWVAADYSLDQSRKYINSAETQREKKEGYYFAVIEDGSDTYAGEVKLIDVKNDNYQNSASIAYWTNHAFLRQGVASQAVKQLAKFAFEELKLIRLEILIDVENTISQKVPEKVGAVYEGKLRNKWFIDGVPKTVFSYSLIPSDLA